MKILSKDETRLLVSNLNIPNNNTSPKGEDHYKAKLTINDVLEIRRAAKKRRELLDQAKQYSNQQIADKYGVSSNCIQRVIYGQSWKSI